MVINRSSTGVTAAAAFGNSSDKPLPADFTGDGKTDIALFRPSTGEWFVLRSEDSSFYSFPFGNSTDIPVPADYDGDGKADAAIFRPSTATWYINKSSGGTTIATFGLSTDLPVPADFDGDGKADIAIYRPVGATGSEWWVSKSSGGTSAVTFGTATDKPVPGDFTGDGKADQAFFRPSTGEWYVLRSNDFSILLVPVRQQHRHPRSWRLRRRRQNGRGRFPPVDLDVVRQPVHRRRPDPNIRHDRRQAPA